MTWLLRIFFSALWMLPAGAASVSGTIRLVNSLAPSVHKQKDYAGVVAWLDPIGDRPAAASVKPPQPARMIQKSKQFVPHVLAIPVGAAVEFPNYDPIFHNAFSTFSGQVFDLGLYPPGKSRTVTFGRSGIVRVFCNIHPAMSAIIAVLDSPWFAVSQPSGAFTVRDVPPGDYQLHIFHERATEQTLKALERRVTVTGEGLTLSPVVISETGYVATPHKNKYDEDYPPVADEHILYPGAHK